MLGPLRQIVGWHCGRPSDHLLLLLHDGEISDRRRARVQRHLHRCPRCRERMARIAQDLKDLSAMNSNAGANATLAEEILVAKVRSSIDAWSAANLPDGSAPGTQTFEQIEAGRQVAAVLGVYLGQRAANALLREGGTSQISKQEGIASAEATLRILLGRKAATAVGEKLAKIINRLPESVR
jgi:anti-sigma factor RsiW